MTNFTYSLILLILFYSSITDRVAPLILYCTSSYEQRMTCRESLSYHFTFYRTASI